MVTDRAPDAETDSAGRHRWRIAEWAFYAFLFMVLVGFEPFKERLLSDPFSASAGDLGRQAAYLAIFAGLCLLAIVTRRLRYLLPPLVLLAAVAWFLASTTWSLAPEITLRRAGLTAIILVSTFAAIGILGTKRSLAILRNTLALIVVVDLASVFIIPQAVHRVEFFDAMELAGSWRGLHYHKNVAGPVVALAALLFLHFALESANRSYWILFSVSIVYVIGTRSKTAILLLFISIICLMAYRLAATSLRARRIFVISSVIILIILAALSAISSEMIADALNDPHLFTGRAAIWHVVLKYVSDHLLFGSGFGAFWQVGASSPIFQLTYVPWLVRTAQTHNGYLELLASTGLVGLALGALAAVVIPLKRLLSFKLPHGDLLFAWMIFSLLLNLTETRLFQGAREEWVLHAVALAIIYMNRGRSQRVNA